MKKRDACYRLYEATLIHHLLATEKAHLKDKTFLITASNSFNFSWEKNSTSDCHKNIFLVSETWETREQAITPRHLCRQSTHQKKPSKKISTYF